MKTRSFRRRNFLLSPSTLTSGSVVLGIAILFVLVRVFFPGMLLMIASPFWKLGTGIESVTTGFTESFGNAAEVAAERDRLQDSVTALSTQNVMLTQKAADLSALLGGRTAATGDILASVVSRPPFSSYDTLVIDAGASKNVSEGALVSGNGGVPLGVISEVTNDFSRVVLYSAPGKETPGWVGSAHTPVTLVGAGAGAFSLSVPSNTTLTVGDMVFVPGAGALPIATVATLHADPASAFTSVGLKPLINPFSITWVEVAPHAFK